MSDGLALLLSDGFVDRLKAGDLDAQEQYVGVIQPALKREVRRIAPDLASDSGLVEDTVGQVWIYLLDEGHKSYDPSRGRARTYLDYAVRNAARQVRASNAPPGQRTRPQKDDPWEFPWSIFEPISTDVEGDLLLIDTIPDRSQDQFALADERMHIEELLAMAEAVDSDLLSPMLHMVYEQGFTLTEIAKLLGVARWVPRRVIDLWVFQHGLVEVL